MPSSPLGFGLLATLCTVQLPMPDGSTLSWYAVQPSFGIGVGANGKVVPSTGSGRALLIADLIRRLSTTRGTLPDPNIPTTLGNFGIALIDYVNADMSASDVGRLCAMVDAQAKQDERVVSSTTQGTLVPGSDVLMLTIALVDGRGPFRLVVSIDVVAGNVTLLQAPSS
jgi:hypothetical protein